MSELLTEIKLGDELVMGHPVKMRAVGLFADPARRCGVVGGEGAFCAPSLLLLKICHYVTDKTYHFRYTRR